MATKESSVDPEPTASSGTSTPEYLALKENYPKLILAVKTQPADYADVLFAKGFISLEVLEFTRLGGTLDSDKARKLVDTTLGRVTLNSTCFHDFINILKDSVVVEKLQESYQRLMANTIKQTDHKEQVQPPIQQCHEPPAENESANSPQSRPVLSIDTGFECPCGNCTIDKYLSKPGCPGNQSEESKPLFPFLRTPALDEDERGDLEEHLKEDTKKMISRFAAFTLIIKISLKRLTLTAVKDFILSLEAFDANIGVSILSSKHEQEIRSASNIDEVFMVLRKYISFFNYDIIEELINNLGSANDQKQLQEYLKAFEEFCQRNVFQVPHEIFSSSRSCKDAKVFILKCTERIATLKGVQALKGRIASTLHLRPSSLRLCSIREGCLELRFLIPVAVAGHIFPVSPTTKSALSKIGVRVLSCETVQQQVDKHDTVPDLSKLKLQAEGGQKSTASGHSPSAEGSEPESGRYWLSQNFALANSPNDINMTNKDKKPFAESITVIAELVHVRSGTITDVQVTRRDQGNKLNFSFTPVHRGRHELRVSINGRPLKPFPLSVAPHPDSLKNPTTLISGLRKPSGVVVNNSGHIVVSDVFGSQIRILDREGKVLKSFGNSRSLFPKMGDIAVDIQDNIYITGYGIQKLSPEGLLLSRAGSHGDGHLQFNHPVSITYNKTNDLVYIADRDNHRIQVLNSDLSFHSTFGKHGSGDGEFIQPVSVCCDDTGNVYVSDLVRVQVFTSMGEFVHRFDHRFPSRQYGQAIAVGADLEHDIGFGDFLRGFQFRHILRDSLLYVKAIAVGDGLVIYAHHHCVHMCMFTLDGEFVGSFGEGVLERPAAIAIDREQNIFVADQFSGEILMF